MFEFIGEASNLYVIIILVVGVISLIVKKSNDSKTVEEKMTDKQKEVRQKEMDRYSEKAEKWACPKCGALNQKYLTTCSCGQTKV